MTSRTIFKYQFFVTDIVRIRMPKGSILLHVDEQRGVPTVWALVDAKAPMVERVIHIYGTGHPVMQDPGTFVGTMLCNSGLVWHIFDGGEVKHD